MATDQDDTLLSFGRALKRRRLELRYSQEYLADLCELDRTYIGSVERGERNISLINIWKIAKALKLHPSELFSERGK